mgnify:CR=1 FL=1
MELPPDRWQEKYKEFAKRFADNPFAEVARRRADLLAIPVAAGVFAFAGLNLPPAVAAVAMSLSTIIVAGNAQLLRRVDLRPVHLNPRRA